MLHRFRELLYNLTDWSNFCLSRVLITCTDNGRLSYWPDEEEKVSVATLSEVKQFIMFHMNMLIVQLDSWLIDQASC